MPRLTAAFVAAMIFASISMTGVAAAAEADATATAPEDAVDDLARVLELQTHVDGGIVERISLFADEINPNVASSGARFKIEHDGAIVAPPDAFVNRLNARRREIQL